MDKSIGSVQKCSTFDKSNNMSRKVPPIDENRLKSNPFTQSLEIAVRERVDLVAMVPDDTGKLVSLRNPVEQIQYTKVFHNADDGDRAIGLSACALRMYVYIIHKMGTDDWIRIMPDNYAVKAEKGSRNSYKRAINELIDEKYICLSPFKYTYYINPARLFCGNRIEKYPDNLKFKGTFKASSKIQKSKSKEQTK